MAQGTPWSALAAAAEGKLVVQLSRARVLIDAAAATYAKQQRLQQQQQQNGGGAGGGAGYGGGRKGKGRRRRSRRASGSGSDPLPTRPARSISGCSSLPHGFDFGQGGQTNGQSFGQSVGGQYQQQVQGAVDGNAGGRGAGGAAGTGAGVTEMDEAVAAVPQDVAGSSSSAGGGYAGVDAPVVHLLMQEVWPLLGAISAQGAAGRFLQVIGGGEGTRVKCRGSRL